MPKIAIFGGTFDPIHWGHLLLAETAVAQFHLDRVLWVPTVLPSYKAQPLATFEHRLEMVRRAIADHPAFTVSAIEQQSGTSYAIATFKALQALEPTALWYWLLGSDAFQSLPRWQGSETLMAQCIWLVAVREMGVGSRESGVWSPESGVGNGESGVGSREWGIGSGESGVGSRENSKLSSVSAHKTFGIPERQRSSQSASATPNSRPSSLIPHPTPDTRHPTPDTPYSTPLRCHSIQMPSIAISSSLIRQYCREGRSIRALVPEVVHSYIAEQNLYQTN